MEKYLIKRKSPPQENNNSSSSKHNCPNPTVNMKDLPSDPGERPRITSYHPNIRDEVRRAYLMKGPTQPKDLDFPLKKFGQQQRRFNRAWFSDFKWLEYSKSKDAAYCLYCYLFKEDVGGQAGGDSFVSEGFSNWKKREKLSLHEGRSNSSHHNAFGKSQDLLNQKQHIETAICKQSDQTRAEYKTRLTATVESVRLLLEAGLAFRGHDESENSRRPGNFLKVLRCLARNNPNVAAVTLKNAPQNNKLTAPEIQKDIASVCASETIKAIVADLGDSLFALLIDEARDVSIKEQMAVVIRYVDKKGRIIECFLGVEHVLNTTALTLKASIDDFFSRYGLSLSRLRGHGYDGASNMRGEFNGLKTLILKENPCAYYVNCFAHQLQLALVALAKKHDPVASLFSLIARVLNVVGSSCKRRDMLRQAQADNIIKLIGLGELSSGQGLNQETSLKRSGDTRWSSHYNTLVSLTGMFDAVIEVLEIIGNDSSYSDNRVEAQGLVDLMGSFEFVFSLHLMRMLLGITNQLSQALQRKDQDIVNAMNLVQVSKSQLQAMREHGWTSFLDDVSTFCEKHEIDVPNMDDSYVSRGRRRQKGEEMKNLHHYRVETFYTIIDLQLHELNTRFTELNNELLLCVACLSPIDLFSRFDKKKLICLAEFYPKDFSQFELWKLSDQVDTYIVDVRLNNEFSSLNGISELAVKMAETVRDKVYPLVFLLLTLALILPVATASVERVFSAMNIVKSRLRNRSNG